MKSIDLNCMPKNTKIVFDKLTNSAFIKEYTLIGGTALSLQIKHRLSEDLDFIYDGESLNINTIKRNINKLFKKYKIIKQDGKYQIDFIIENTKVTFFSSAAVFIQFPVKAHSFNYKNMNIANIECIACLKFSAIAQRNTIRDYYDLYYISKYHSNLEKIINNAKELLPNLAPITYTETLVYTEDLLENDLSNHLKPKIKISKQKISKYFTIELKKILKNKVD
ncbi:MAG: nucleotidyl transferase AbiEii/AbiGii toxin family protein [Bacteroidales bacterium]|nr:nucleotidyl transferase AbiEii/AbiGii toxin family protein [Bacteroidales bacterium]